MKYELELIGINEETENADALCFRFYSEKKQRYLVGVYDGGTKKYGDALKDHLKQYYFNNTDEAIIDAVICSHPDKDHASGLTVILDNFQVKRLYMNRPWLYINDIFDKVNDGRITKQSLEKRLKDAYPFVRDLEEQANEKGIPIYETFQGDTIMDSLKVLSPNKEFYLDLLIESNKTPLNESPLRSNGLFSEIRKAVLMALESWTNELLREDVVTSAENESSLILYGDMDTETFLLTGDAGVRGLNVAIDYAEKKKIDLKSVNIYQIPHHGGRHNVSPSVLNNLLGPIINKTDSPTKQAYVSVAKGSDHPRKMVVNAFIRRGAKVFEARSFTLCHHIGTPTRDGWNSVESLPFNEQVEDWEK